jgi:anti-anti-sigma factor
MDDLSIQRVVTEDGVELKLSGELLFLDSQEFMKDVPNQAEDCGRKVVLDMAQLKFIDSAGLGAILYVSEALRMKGRRLVIRSANQQNLNLLKKIQNVGTFTIEDAK